MPEEITFYSKREIICPVCNTPFKREDLLTGRGRLNAGELTNELRRMYISTQKYGDINPLIYPITVCPNCYYASEKEDFTKISSKTAERLADLRSVRAQYVMKIFGYVPDFFEKRDLVAGIASYIFAISSYSVFEKKKFSPTVKCGVASLRAAWLFGDLFRESQNTVYQELSEVFYRKAADFYTIALQNQYNGKEGLDYANWLGPDTDYNFGYDGFLYICGILRYKNTVYIEDPYEKIRVYEEVKRTLSKVFGMGRRAKDKPQILLDLARDVYDKIGEEVGELKSSLEGGGGAVDSETETEEIFTEENQS
jgi:hypothetical protein